jgi:hypothetical protein
MEEIWNDENERGAAAGIVPIVEVAGGLSRICTFAVPAAMNLISRNSDA